MKSIQSTDLQFDYVEYTFGHGEFDAIISSSNGKIFVDIMSSDGTLITMEVTSVSEVEREEEVH